IFKTFFELSQNKIGIFITHKPSITQSVNKILYLDNGCIAETGSFADLNIKGMKFKNLLDKEIGATYDTSN
ncbi:TPA: ABC transporter ATP-binding protein, partial [Streptococcus pyogenes]